ncbi:MAG: asparagine synthase (glutamine-hydrolyzing) [Bacteroidetes bacterium]|nr:asparagine synthase (glutamine-hydrolyzing) [Bacteroidota bacterium]
MCGIAGSVTWRNQGASLDTFDIARLAYRGPDALTTLASDALPQPPARIRWKLAHARLSILDLAANANQPMCTPDGRYWLVFNGEIYNNGPLRAELTGLGHRFTTDHSDSETLLHACIHWGKAALERLNGMFAFVFIDNLEGTLLAARDRMGIKPLYFRLADGVFSFASEPKAFTGPRRVNKPELLGFFNFLQVEGTATFYEGLEKLPAAHLLELRDGTAPRPQRWWHPLQAAPNGRDLGDARPCMDLLREAVDLQMVADVGVGTYLSGGLDSSVITALASKGHPVNTFSIGFEEGIPGYASELGHARAVADHLRTKHHPITISPEEYLLAQKRVFRILDEPIANSACGPLLLLSECARAEGVKVCLSGEGADELFIGYRHWHDARRVDNYLRTAPRWAWKALYPAMPLLRRRKPQWAAWMQRHLRHQYIIWGGIDAMGMQHQQALFSPGFMAQARDPYGIACASYDAPACRHADLLQRLSAFDLHFHLPEYLLARVDRMSMAASIEARVPFLDHRLVEQAMRLKLDLLTGPSGQKLALKQFARTLLPASIIDRPKVGFEVPMQKVLNAKEALRHRDLLLAMDDALGIYAPGFRKQLASGNITGKLLWPHFVLANWWNIHIAGN